MLSLLSLYFLFNPSQFQFFPKCPFHEITGYYCPGCGSQRAIHDVLQLHILEAFSHNALMITTLFGGIAFFIADKKRFQHLIYHPKTPIIILVIVLLFWILRNIAIEPFLFLAP